MLNCFSILLTAILGLSISQPVLAQKPSRKKSLNKQRPNIIVTLADDLGYSDIGAYGGEINTSHLDRLAEGGARFTQFYNTPRCCLTRASLPTALYPQQTGVG